MDDETRDRLDTVVFWTGMTMIVVGVTGEVLGWWGELGLLLSGLGAAAGLWATLDRNGRAAVRQLVRQGARFDRVDATLAGLAAGQQRALQGQATLLGTQDELLAKQERTLDKQDQMLGKQDQMLGKQDQALELHARVLTVNERILERQDRTIDVLDRIQHTLDERLPPTG